MRSRIRSSPSPFFSEFDHLIGRLIGLFRIHPSCVLGWGDVHDCILRPVVLSTDINGYLLIRHIDNGVPVPGFVSSTALLVGFELEMTIKAVGWECGPVATFPGRNFTP